MGQSFRSSSGRVLRLGQILGKGGEGTVYSIEGDGSLAAKIYLPGLASSRREKITAMVQAGWHKHTEHVAFPIDLLSDQTGAFSGFTMRRVGGDRPIHQLYSPTGRKTSFPNASFPFLLRVSSNVARAIASVNATGCVIGDVNHSGVLVSADASVTLIDCDSFQVPHGARLYKCKVGVPEFTPPELQGKSLDGIVRTVNHDSFGLAVLIFYTIMMGRHPFAGRYLGPGVVMMEKAIEEYRFAYSARRAATQTEPPPNVPTLVDLPLALADAFEKAFAPSGATRRPTAVDWIRLLDFAESQLIPCSQVQSHHYFRNATSCPWCRLEAAFPGFLAFLPKTSVLTGGPSSLGSLIAAIRSVPDPGEAPRLTSLMPAISITVPSSGALKARHARMLRWAGGIFCAGIGIYLFNIKGPGPLGGLLSLGCGAFLAFSKPKEFAAVERAVHIAKSVWRDAEETFAQQTGNGSFLRARREAESISSHIQGFAADEKRELDQLSNKRRDAQMRRHLERYLIDGVKIKGIGNARKLTLKSYGIESAADVEVQRILAISGFGQSILDSLLSWRRSAENHFKFDPSEPVKQVDIDAIRTSFARKRADGEAQLRRLFVQLQKLSSESLTFRSQGLQKGISAWNALKQAEVDIEALNSTAKTFGAGIAIVAMILLTIVVLARSGGQPKPLTHIDVVRESNTPTPPALPNIKLPPRSSSSDASRPIGPLQERVPIPLPRQARDSSQAEVPSAGPGAITSPPPLPPAIDVGGTVGDVSNVDVTLRTPTSVEVLPRRDPLKASDALWIQERLRAAGYYIGREKNWGSQSREALRSFKAINGLSLDDKWDLATEERIGTTGPQVRAEHTFLGDWASSPSDCRQKGARQPLRISSRRAQTDGGTCEFEDIQSQGRAWRVRAHCAVGSEKWPTDIEFSVDGKWLTWTSSTKGTDKYFRCN